MSAFKPSSFFGGAITAEIPSEFTDVSKIRDVPDNQEVYVARTGLASIIIEILDRVAPPDHPCNSDEEALLYHYQDVTASGHTRDEQGVVKSQEETKVWCSNKAHVDHLPSNPAYTLLGTQRPQSAPSNEPDFTAIVLALIRLPEQATDILLTINIPHSPAEYDPQTVDLSAGKWGPLIEDAFQIRKKLLSTFKVDDWDLFVAS